MQNHPISPPPPRGLHIHARIVLAELPEEVNTMKRTRMIAAAAVVALTLGVGAGFATAQSDPTPTPVGAPGMHSSDMNEMHSQMRSNMPSDMQDLCDTTHGSMHD